MFRKKIESDSGTEIADSGFLIILKKTADSGSRIRIAIPACNISKKFQKYFFGHFLEMSDSVRNGKKNYAHNAVFRRL